MKNILLVAIPVILADQLLKLYARAMTTQIVLIPGVLALSHFENTGIAFSLFSGYPTLMALFSVVIVLVSLFALSRMKIGPVAKAGIGLMLGGAIGNMIDRLVFGSVTDMIQTLFIRFAVFNLADAALVIGCLLITWSVFFRPDDWRDIDAD